MPFGSMQPTASLGFEMARLTGEAAAQCVEFCGGRHAPCHFAQRRAFFESGRQRRIVRIDDDDRAAVQRFEARVGFVVRDFFQTPVAKKRLQVARSVTP